MIYNAGRGVAWRGVAWRGVACAALVLQRIAASGEEVFCFDMTK